MNKYFSGLLAVLTGIGLSVASHGAHKMVRIDGSSTVYPISAALAEEFQNDERFQKIRVTVAYSGTGGGFKKWVLGETDINDASREIKQKEIDRAKKNNISYIELPVAYDGITVVVSQKNTFAKTLTMEQLKAIWQPGSHVKKWSDINPKWPNEAIKLYGPGHDSGTFDYFTEAVVGKSRASRSDYTASEDDNVLVKGVMNDPYALAYFGYAYYLENKTKLRSITIDGGKGPVAPVDATIADATYPLSRPIFIYVSNIAVKRPEVRSFVEYYLENMGGIVPQVGYTALSKKDLAEAKTTYEKFVSTASKS